MGKRTGGIGAATRQKFKSPYVFPMAAKKSNTPAMLYSLLAFIEISPQDESVEVVANEHPGKSRDWSDPFCYQTHRIPTH